MARFLVHWLSTAVALFVCSHIVPGVHVDSYATLAVASLVLGFINAIIRPILLFLTLPITLLTLGLFYFVVNGLAFAMAAWIVPGFDVDSIGSGRRSRLRIAETRSPASLHDRNEVATRPPPTYTVV